MLAAGPARAVDIDLQVLRPDFDVGGLLDLRDDLDQRERRMAPVRLVEWRQPNQPVNAALRAEPAEGALQMAVVLGHRQFRQTDDVTGPSFEFSPDLDLLPQSLRFLGEPLRSRGLLPDVGVG